MASTAASGGAWQDGDPPGHRRFARVGDLRLESGRVLPGVRIAYETWGEFDGGNAVLVLHALTGDSHVVGPAGPGHPTPGWWPGLVGPGAPIDTDRYFVVAPNVLGGCQGTTGPASPLPFGRGRWGGLFPRLTVRDQVAAEALLSDALGVGRWAAVIGGSMGGMRALEWAATWPERVGSVMALATCAAATADQIGLVSAQVHAVRADPAFRGGDYYESGSGPRLGLGVARRIAHLSYRGEAELQERFGRRPQGDGSRFAIESYLDHHAEKLARRFDANSYVVLSEAMNSHDVGRGRGGAVAALGRFTGRAMVVGIDSDRLYPPAQQEEIAATLGCEARIVASPHGHDGFLVESDAVGTLAAELLRAGTRIGH